MDATRAPEEEERTLAGSLERALFAHRRAVLAAAAAATVALGAVAARSTVVSAGFEEMRPAGHPWVRAYAARADRLRGLGDSVLVALESTRGDVYDTQFQELLRDVTDELFLSPGVDRPWVKSLWTPSVRWTEVGPDGLRGGPVLPAGWDGSPASLAALRRNVERSGGAGGLVAADARSTLVFVPLLDRDPATGRPPDPRALAARIEALRMRHEAGGAVRLHAVGFAVLVGALRDGITRLAAWFALSAAIVTGILGLHSRCVRSTALVIGCALVGIIWQLGLAGAAGVPLDPFSALVPFLLFAAGVSHGAQRMNGVLLDVARGTDRVGAARRAFRRLLAPGAAALLTDLVGYAALVLVDVPAVRRLALVASLGVAAQIVTSLVLLPVLLSFTGVSAAAAARALRVQAPDAPISEPWRLLGRLTEPRPAAAALAAIAIVCVGSLAALRDLRLGASGPGATELAPSSRYNRDAAFIARQFGASSHPFAVMIETPPEGCAAFETLVEADRLAAALRQVPGVRGVTSLADAVRRITAEQLEGCPRWRTLSRDQRILDGAAEQAVTRNPDLFDPACSLLPVIAQLEDHGAATLARVAGAADAFARAHAVPGRAFVLAAGAGAFEAATNDLVARVTPAMTALVLAAIVLLCRMGLGSWRAVPVAVAPLVVTSLACEALMARLGIGLQLSTLPVIALGMGIPDYALYLLSVQLAFRREGLPLGEAHRRALQFNGRVVAVVSLMLSAGVATWIASPITFQAQMGLLLSFMFLGNAASALVLVPALSRLLLASRTP